MDNVDKVKASAADAVADVPEGASLQRSPLPTG